MTLRRDEGVPSARRPRFQFKFLSARQQRDLSRDFDRLAGTGPDEIDKVFVTLAKVLTGWQNVIDPGTDLEMPFAPDRAMDVLCLGDALELVYRFLGHSPSAEDLGNFSGQSASPPGGSAPPDGAATATADQTT